MAVEGGLLGIVWILFVVQLSEIPRCHGKMSCLSWWSSSYEMWSSGCEGTFHWDGRVSFLLWEMASLSLSSSTFPHSSHTHLLSTHFPFPLTLLHPYKGLYICAHKHKLFPFHCNMNRHVHTASHLDVTALPGLLFAILKTPLLSLSKLQADGDESAWRSLGSCESCFFFSLSVYLETILRTPLAARRGNLSSTAWHISVRVQGFLLLHTTLLRSLRGGIFVRICALKHVINNPVCSKWMTRPSVAAISWTATSLSLSSALEGWNLSKLMKYWRHSL